MPAETFTAIESKREGRGKAMGVYMPVETFTAIESKRGGKERGERESYGCVHACRDLYCHRE